MTQEPQEYDPLITPLRRKFAIVTLAIEELRESLDLTVIEIRRLRQLKEKIKKQLMEKAQT